jgi:hypothetical protein
MDEMIAKYQGLIDLTVTTEDVVRLGEEIDILLKGLYHVESSEFEQKLEREVRVRVAAEIRKLLQASADQSKEEIKVLLGSVNRVVGALPIVKLVLAFEPSEQVIANISHWCRMNLERQVVIDLSIDRSILGGAVIIYRGKFYDLTLRKKLQEIFEKGAFI